MDAPLVNHKELEDESTCLHSTLLGTLPLLFQDTCEMKSTVNYSD